MIGEDSGDSIMGERIVCEARIISKPVLVHRTGKAQGAEIKACREPCGVLDRKTHKEEDLIEASR